MDKSLTLKVETREQSGTHSAKKVRQSGKIPAVVYGHKEQAVPVAVNSHDFTEGLAHGHRIMDLQMGRKKQKVVIKDIQYDYLGKNIIHADLMRVDATELIKVMVPIELKGVAKGTHESGIINEHADSLEVECRVTDIPETIVVSIKEMDVGDNLHASEVELPDGVKLISSEELLIATCSLVAAAQTTEEAEEEAPAEPEVIGQKEEQGETEEQKPEK